MNIAQCIQHIYPNAKVAVDFLVQDDSDGSGAYIAQWNLPEPQPTQAELAAAWEMVKNVSPAPSDSDRLKAVEDWILDQMLTQMMGGLSK